MRKRERKLEEEIETRTTKSQPERGLILQLADVSQSLRHFGFLIIFLLLMQFSDSGDNCLNNFCFLQMVNSKLSSLLFGLDELSDSLTKIM